MIKEPTEEQAKILSHEGNIVVTARPGSGKTYTVVEKIRIVLEKDSKAFIIFNEGLNVTGNFEKRL